MQQVEKEENIPGGLERSAQYTPEQQPPVPPADPGMTTRSGDQPKQDIRGGQKDEDSLTQPTKKGIPANLGCVGGLFYAINKPWLLLAIPLIAAGMWLANNPAIITDNLNQPYALLAGPTLVGSVLAGYLILAFFKTIIEAIKQTWQVFQEWRTKEGSTFWMVIWVFLLVSVAESGSFFNGLLGPLSLNGILGYAVAFVIDLVAVECMRARMAAVRMRDISGQNLYLLGVIICSLLSAFANGYTSLLHFHEPTGTLIPWIMVKVAPWIGMVFPLLMTFLSFASDYTADQVSSKLDPENYERQENTRIKLLEIQRDKLKQRVSIEREIDQLTERKKKEGREFIILRWLFPKKSPGIGHIAEEVVELIRKELDPNFKQIDGKLDFLYQVGQTNSSQIQRIDQNLSILNSSVNAADQEWQSIQNSVSPAAIEAHIRTVFADITSTKETSKFAKKAANSNTNMSSVTPPKQGAPLGKTEVQGTLSTQQELLNFLKNAPVIRAQIESIVRRDPANGYDQAAALLRQNGVPVTGLFVKEAWVSFNKQNIGDVHQRTAKPSLQSANKNSEFEPGKTVKALVRGMNTSEQEEKILPKSEQPSVTEAASQGQVSSSKTEKNTPVARLPEIPTTPPIHEGETDNLTMVGQESDTGIQENEQAKTVQQTDPLPVVEAGNAGQREETRTLLGEEKGVEMNTQMETKKEQNTEGLSGIHFDSISAQLEEEHLEKSGIIRVQENEFEDHFHDENEKDIPNSDEIDGDNEDADFEMGENAGRRRGNYYAKASDVAIQFQCSLEHIRFAIENKQLPVNNQLELSGRTNKETTPLEEWKIKRSSLIAWVPPVLPKKRGRPTQKLVEVTA